MLTEDYAVSNATASPVSQFSGADVPREHIQKAAVFPFLLAVEGLLAKGVAREADPQLEIDESGLKPRLRVKVLDHDKEGNAPWAYPVPPLNFNIHIEGKHVDFSEEIKQSRAQVGHRPHPSLRVLGRRAAIAC